MVTHLRDFGARPVQEINQALHGLCFRERPVNCYIDEFVHNLTLCKYGAKQDSTVFQNKSARLAIRGATLLRLAVEIATFRRREGNTTCTPLNPLSARRHSLQVRQR